MSEHKIDNAVDVARQAHEPTAAEYFEMPLRIAGNGDIYIGEHKIPGCIESGSVTVHPGNPDECNRLTVTFLVGKVHLDDPLAVTE